MRCKCTSNRAGIRCLACRQQAGVRPVVLMLVCFLFGLGLSAYWFHRTVGKSGGRTVEGATGPALTDATRAILGKLAAPVEIRFYSSLDPASVSAETRDFATRVGELLAAYQSDAGSRLKVSRITAGIDLQVAAADGITPFNQDKGDACYLGVAVSCGAQKESFARLSPDWEAALESDLSRAIEHVSREVPSTRGGAAVAAAMPPSASVVATLKSNLPDLAAISVEEGTQKLRDAALEKFKAAAAELQTKLAEAQNELAQAQATGSTEAVDAARKHLQQVQSVQTEKLKAITAGLQEQIEALQQLKKP
jgi:hypothetical protein